MNRISSFSRFGKNLRMLRKERHLTQGELAEAVGLSQSLLSLYETGTRLPTSSVLDLISDYFDVTPDFLIGRTVLREESLPDPAAFENRAASEEHAAPSDGARTARTICDAVTVLFGLLNELPDQAAATAAERSLETLIDQLYRDLARISPEQAAPPADSETPELLHCAYDAELSMNRIAYVRALEEAKNSLGALPDCSYPALKNAYPNEYQSLVRLLHEDGMHTSEYLTPENGQ